MKTLEQMSLREKLGQMFVTGFPSTTISEEMIDVIENYHVGNMIIFSHNVANKQQLSELVRELQKHFVKHNGVPGFITIDQEGGRVVRMPEEATNIAGAMAIASTGKPEYAYEAGKLTAKELKAIGINFNLAPVMDINNNPLNPVINIRSYGDKAETVSTYGIQMMKGLLDEGVMSSLKHFPGHGDTNVDSHLGLPVIDKTLEELEALELVPFKAAIDAGAKGIMSAHILFPQIEKSGLPGTMSRTIITDILKGKLGYKGLVVSDCLEMNAIKEFYGTAKGALGAVKAGVDLVFISHSPLIVKDAIHEIEAAVESGELDIAIIDQAVANILAHKAIYAPIEEHQVEVVGCQEHQAISQQIRTESISLVQGAVTPIEIGSKDVCVLGSLSYRTDLASSSVNNDLCFASYVGNVLKIDAHVCDLSPSEAEIDSLVDLLKQYKHIVFGVFNARENSGQLSLAKKLISSGCKVTLIALGRPYDLALIEGAAASLTLMEYSKPAFASIIPILLGEKAPTGQLTIAL